MGLMRYGNTCKTSALTVSELEKLPTLLYKYTYCVASFMGRLEVV